MENSIVHPSHMALPGPDHPHDDPLQPDRQLPQIHQPALESISDQRTRHARAADRGRRNLRNMLAIPDASIMTKAFAHVCDGAASALSYSAAAASSPGLYERSMTSGAAWAASAVFSSIHRTFYQNRTIAGLLSDTTNFGAGIASMATTGLSHAADCRQQSINYAATSGNALWATSGLLAALTAMQEAYTTAGTHPLSLRICTATGLRVSAGLAHAAAAGVGIGSTVVANGNDQTLNKISSGLWMAATVLDTAGTILSRTAYSAQQQRAHV